MAWPMDEPTATPLGGKNKKSAEIDFQDSPSLPSHERLPTPPPQLASSTSTSDYLTPVPYSMSSLALVSEYHLPERPDPRDPYFNYAVQARHPTPQPTPTLITAYHYVLTNPPPATPSSNPLRHRVAMSLLKQLYTTPRWTAADTLYTNVLPPAPRVVAPPPSVPVPLKEVPHNSAGDIHMTDKGKDKRPQLLPPPVSRPLAFAETITPLSSQATSRIPETARQVLPVRELLSLLILRSKKVINTNLSLQTSFSVIGV